MIFSVTYYLELRNVMSIYCIFHIISTNVKLVACLGGSLPLIFCIHVRSGPIYWGEGVIYLAKKIIRWWYFTCKKPENIICDGILDVNMFHYFTIPYFTCTFFSKFIYNDYIGPYFFNHTLFLKKFASAPPLEVAWPL